MSKTNDTHPMRISSSERKAVVPNSVAVAAGLLTWSIVSALAGMLLLGAAPALAQSVSLNLSGYETFLGRDCPPGTCGVTFSGWTGGGGNVAGGWAPFPGDGQGQWRATVDYSGKAAFGATVNIVGGNWRIVLKGQGRPLSGTVTGGTVTWPAAGESLDCGTNVARVEASFAVDGGGTASFHGCLHDLPSGSVIPPKVWGIFTRP